MIRKIIWYVIVAFVAVALIRVFPWNDPGQAWNALGDASDKFGTWVTNVFQGLHVDEIKPPDSGILSDSSQGPIPTDVAPE